MDRRTTSRGVSQVPAVLRLRVDASICATEPNTPAPHGDLDRWPEVALYCSRREAIARPGTGELADGGAGGQGNN